MQSYFVTGTDTNIGKTIISCGLLNIANQKKFRTLAIKPVATGSQQTNCVIKNQDALELMNSINIKLTYQQINPYTYLPPIAPHIAAKKINHVLTLKKLVKHCNDILSINHDFSIIEGAGGWKVPINHTEYLSDLPIKLKLPVIIVVGLKIGCINHALLTIEAIKSNNLKIAGWVANTIDPKMLAIQENIDTLKERISYPLLGIIPYINQPTNQHIASFLKLP